MHFLYNELCYIHYNSPYIYLGYFLDKIKHAIYWVIISIYLPYYKFNPLT